MGGFSHPEVHLSVAVQVNEEPGTYFWHGHSGTEKVDSFFGPLIVRPRGPEPVRYDEEHVLLLTDNYHEEAAPLTFGLNRYVHPIA
jgi:FtsP/CotA-like multicopper oxidase with cupredoxin domain